MTICMYDANERVKWFVAEASLPLQHNSSNKSKKLISETKKKRMQTFPPPLFLLALTIRRQTNTLSPTAPFDYTHAHHST